MENKIQLESQNLLETDRSEIINVNTICRLCAAADGERFIGIFSTDGISNDLHSKINLYLPIKVSINDNMPLQLCLNCASTLLAWHELVVTTVEADKKFHRCHFINGNKHTDNEEDLEQIGADCIASDENEGMDPEPMTSLNDFCQTEATEEISIPLKPSPKMKRAKKVDVITYYPPQESSHSLETYMTDMDHHLMIDPLTDGDPDNIGNYKIDIEHDSILADDDKKHVVPKDLSDFNSDDSLKIDEDNVSSYFACQHCSAVFIMKRDAMNHICNDHPGKDMLVNPFVEPVGDDVTNANLKKERRKHSKIDQDITNAAKVVVDGRVYYNCKECGKSLHSPYTYVWHMRIHTGERPYVCDLCGKQFRVSQGLVRHLRETHQGIKKFPCDLCGRMFATRRNVEEHRRIHTNERPYVCDLCGKSFKQKASLFVHKRSHKNYFPFKCSYCNQGFRTKPPLMVHITRHTGEKPYKCDICGRCFRIKYELKRHRLIHSDEKPFVCVVCGLSFRQKRYLRNHTKSNHTSILP